MREPLRSRATGHTVPGKSLSLFCPSYWPFSLFFTSRPSRTSHEFGRMRNPTLQSLCVGSHGEFVFQFIVGFFGQLEKSHGWRRWSCRTPSQSPEASFVRLLTKAILTSGALIFPRQRPEVSSRG